MTAIPFPSAYKQLILAKKKNTTIRLSKEIGRYKAGKTYLAVSYAGADWKTKIKILKATKTTIDKLAK